MKDFISNVVKTIGDFFKGPSGDGSAKRLLAIACFASAITYFLLPVSYTGPKDSVAMGVLVAAGTTLLGVAAVTKS